LPAAEYSGAVDFGQVQVQNCRQTENSSRSGKTLCIASLATVSLPWPTCLHNTFVPALPCLCSASLVSVLYVSRYFMRRLCSQQLQLQEEIACLNWQLLPLLGVV
jgi:hypothetical protein